MLSTLERTLRSVFCVILFLLSIVPFHPCAIAGTNTWTTNGPAGGIFWALEFDPADPNIVYAGGYNTGVYKSTDGGATWTATGKPSMQVTHLAADPAGGGTLYAANAWGSGLYKSTDKGVTWTASVAGMPSKIDGYYLSALVIDPVNPANLYISSSNGGVYRSTNRGDNWTAIGTGIFNPDVRVMAVQPGNSANLLSGTWGSGMFKSINGGNTWTALTLPTGFTSTYIYALLVDAKDSAVVYAGTAAGVLRSSDRGASWTAINSGLVDKTVYALASGTNSTSTIHAGTGATGVFSYTNAAAALTLYYPRLVTTDGTGGSVDNSEYTGIGVANLGTASASLTFTAHDLQGALISGTGITNPATVELAAGAQIPIVDVQVWGSRLSSLKPVGWFTMNSTSSKVVGFFLSYNATLSVLDGADVSSTRLDAFVFPEVEAKGFTQLHVANPGAAAATATFNLKGSNGAVRNTVARSIPANGSVSEKLDSIFAGEVLDGSEYISVTASASLVPFEYLGNPPYRVEGLNGQSAAGGAATLYSPQYAVGGGNWATTLSIVNLEAVEGTVTLRLIDDNGVPVGVTRALPIASSGKIRVTDQDFFVSAGNMLTQGYVEIKSSGPKLTGSVVFGDPAGNSFAAALPLVAALQNDLVFSQVASDATWYTGLALLNPGSANVSATVAIYDRSGKLVQSIIQEIPAGRRVSGLLTQYFPSLASTSISSGYIRVISDKPVASFALFGAANVLSAVPPQIVP
jgi:hypothetical protein